MMGWRRGLAIAAGASFLLAALAPCPPRPDAPSGADFAAAHAAHAPHAAVHAAHPSHPAALGHGAHHAESGTAAEEAGTALSAPCPCGCDGAPAAAGGGASLSKPLLAAHPDAPLPGEALAAPSPPRSYPGAPTRGVDHVPIPV